MLSRVRRGGQHSAIAGKRTEQDGVGSKKRIEARSGKGRILDFCFNSAAEGDKQERVPLSWPQVVRLDWGVRAGRKLFFLRLVVEARCRGGSGQREGSGGAVGSVVDCGLFFSGVDSTVGGVVGNWRKLLARKGTWVLVVAVGRLWQTSCQLADDDFRLSFR